MAPRKEKPRDERRVELKVPHRIQRPVPVAGGFAIPPTFDVIATVHDPKLGPITVEFPVEVSEGRARVRKVTVGTERPTGVGYNVLRAVPVRDLLASACALVLRKVEFTKPGSAKLTLAQADEASIEAIRTLVGWRER